MKEFRSVLNLTVIVAGLGYFVDLFDITLFGVVRTSSLNSIGIVEPSQVLSSGLLIYNSQMAGMMIGGLFWGVLADRRGRLSVMFGSILLYSASNFANIFVWDPTSYAIVRFLGGVGLAGELGAAVTLVAESLPIEKRGLGTTVVATLGMFGIICAALIGQFLSWKVAYLAGGILGIFLLFARFKISESSIFENESASNRGNVFLLLKRRNILKYLSCIVVGIPIYFTTGVLFTFAPELTRGLGVSGTVTAGNAILFGSIGLTIGDLLSGLLSYRLRSRKKAIAMLLVSGLLLVAFYCLAQGLTSTMIYFMTFLIGICVGYWAVMVTVAAEQFGTNIRATAATTIPNFVRGSAIFAVSAFAILKNHILSSHAALIVGGSCFLLALLALTQLDETFGRDLNYTEK